MSAVNDLLARIERDLHEAEASTKPIDGRKMLADVAWLLGMAKCPSAPAVEASGPDDSTPATRPRLWKGPVLKIHHWWWMEDEKEWGAAPNLTLRPDDIFVPGCFPRPTEAPKHVSQLPYCSKVDW